MTSAPATTETTLHMGTITIQGLNIFFTREGGEAYLQDVPTAELHRLDSGHFALEDGLEYIASQIRRFYAEQVHGV